MSDKDSFDVGFYTIESATIERFTRDLKPFDISNYISTLSFTESIHSPILYGEMQIVDASGILDNFPLLGEEIFTLTYTDWFGKSIIQEFIIYGMSDGIPTTQTNEFYYTLKFVSPQHIKSSTISIQKSYTGSITDIAQLIFDEYLVDETFINSANELEIEDTTGVQTLVIPAMQPIQAMDFLRRRSFSADNKSSNFYFFQSRDKFKFVTHEKLIQDKMKTAPIYNYDPALLVENIENRSSGMLNLNSFVLRKRFNTMDEINSGSMVMDVIEVDILNKQYLHNIYRYKDKYTDYQHTDVNVRFSHTDPFVETYFSDDNVMKSSMIFTDFERASQNYKEIIGNRFANHNKLMSIEAEVEIFGRNDLFAGDLIYLNLPKFEEKSEIRNKQHETLSGNWIVTQIQHIFADTKYKSKLTISKDLVRSGAQSNGRVGI